MEIHFEINNRCMLSCRHCSSMATKFKGEMEYSEKDMLNLLKNLGEEKEVFLTGGEPLLYPHLDSLLDYLYSQLQDLRLGLFTTGIVSTSGKLSSISEEYAHRLFSCGLRVCYLSVYSHLEQEHDLMTRECGSFNMLNSSLKNLQNAGVEIRFNSVVTKRNRTQFNDIIAFAEKNRVTEVRMLKLVGQGRAIDCWDEIGVTGEDYRSTVINALKRDNKTQVTCSGAIDIMPCRRGAEINSCPAGIGGLYVSNNGNIFPCASVKCKEEFNLGNISEDGIVNKINNWRDSCKDSAGRMLCL